MEPLIIGVIVAAALACPVLMCGPMVLRRLGILTRGAVADCEAPMKRGASADLSELHQQRENVDREISELEASVRDEPVSRAP